MIGCMAPQSVGLFTAKSPPINERSGGAAAHAACCGQVPACYWLHAPSKVCLMD